MRLLHAHAGNLFGGVETMLLTLARDGAAAGLESSFALSYDERLSRELSELDAALALVGEARLSRPWSVVAARRRFAHLLRRDPPDIVMCHSAWSQVIFGPVAQAARKPLVRWFHTAPHAKDWLERWARWTRPALGICNSRFTAQAVERVDAGLPRDIVYPPVSLAAPEAAGTRSAVRAELSSSNEAVAILQVGRMEPGKGHALLLDALGRLASRPNWALWEVGGAQREREVQYLGVLGLAALRHGIAGRVRFLGERTDTRALYLAADIYCQPNTHPESFGLTFIEALHAGLPVVTSDLGGAREIVDSSCGVLVPPGDAVALADALGRLLDDPAARRALGAAGPARARALCSPATQLARLRAALARATRP